MVLERCAERKIQTQCQQAGNRPTTALIVTCHMTRRHQSSICPCSVCVCVFLCFYNTPIYCSQHEGYCYISANYCSHDGANVNGNFFAVITYLYLFVIHNSVSFPLFITQHTFLMKLASFLLLTLSLVDNCLRYFSPVTINC